MIYSSAIFIGVPLSIWFAGHVGYLSYIIGSALIFVDRIAWMFASAQFRDHAVLARRPRIFWRGSHNVVASKHLYARPETTTQQIAHADCGHAHLATAVGLLFSGYVTDNIDWHLIFLPSMICVVTAIFLLARYFPQVPAAMDPRLESVDSTGIALLAIGLIALQIVLSRGEIDDWFGSAQIQALTWIAAMALLLFVVWQTSPLNSAPLQRLDLIRNRNVLASIPLGIMAGIILSGSIYPLPEFLRNVDPNKLSATSTGQIMCVYALTAAAIRSMVTMSIGKFGQRKSARIRHLNAHYFDADAGAAHHDGHA